MTDADRAFEEWDRSRLDAYTNIDTWHAAVAWATARERERAARIAEGDRTQIPEGRVKSHVLFLVRQRCAIATAIRRDVDAAPLPPTAVDDSKAPDDARYGDPHIGAGQSESVGTHGVDGDSLSIPDRSEPPADLVERAKAAWLEYDRRTTYEPSLPAFIAAFAAEYAAEQAGGTNAERINKTSITRYWKDRAEAAEQALAEEREACAKVTEGWPTEAAGDQYMTCGNGSFWDAGGIYDQARADAAAAIRARKGEADVT